MKILAGALAFALLATPAFAQSGTAAPTPPAGGDKPVDTSAPAADATAAPKPAPAATPEPEQAPEGTTPVKPADAPSR